MLLAGLILLAACANLGSLFAARAADRSRDVALRLALGASRIRILRQLLVEAGVIALAGGAVGLWGSIVLLRALTTWHPIPKFPLNVPVSPDASVYLVALALALLSALVFGLVPARQVLRTGPYQVIKSRTGRIGGPPDHASRRTARGTNRDLRGAGDRVARRRSRIDAVAADQLWLRPGARAARRHGLEHGRATPSTRRR